MEQLTLAPREARAIASLVRQLGERALLEHVGISRLSLARALAGLPVRRGTLLQLKLSIKELGVSRPNRERRRTFGE